MVPGADRVIEVNPNAVPPLCRAWVLLSCPKSHQHCKHRHYFCSLEEKTFGVEWRQKKDSKAEMSVLKCIAAREALLSQIKIESDRSVKRFFDDSERAGVQEHHVKVLLTLMDRLRLVTVQTTEAIIKWREATEQQARLREDEETKAKRQKWVVTIAVTGKRLYDASPAYRSNVKRFRRDKEFPKKANDVRFLGVFNSKVEAARVYDAAMLQEAVKQGTTASRMPEKRFVLRACQKHYAVESVTSPKYRPCEQCIAKTYNGQSEYTAAYIWNGENYLLKISSDTEFLRTNEALRQWLGSDFQFEGNPLMLAAGIDSYIALADEKDNEYPETPLGTASTVYTASRSSTSNMKNDDLAGDISDALSPREFEPSILAENVDTLRGTSAPFTFSRNAEATFPGNQSESDSDSPRPNTTVGKINSALKRKRTKVNSNQRGSTPLGQTARKSFGTPSSALRKLGGGVTSWGGKAALGTKFAINMPFHPSSEQGLMNNGEEKKEAYFEDDDALRRSSQASRHSQRGGGGMLRGEPIREQKRFFEVLEIGRVAASWKQVHAEQVLNELLNNDNQSHQDNILSKHPLGHLINEPAKTRHNSLAKLKEGMGGGGSVNVFAVYKDKGAILSIEQERKPLAHRSDQIWCRSDVGEWSGMQKTGPNIKSFEFGVKLKEEGKKKQLERVRVGALLRKEVLKDISEVNIELVKSLIVQALELKGSRCEFVEQGLS